MKKATEASPNHALKRERKLRCWSQLEVADQIGTTAFNVSRWERGITSPGSYFRQQLCLIFGKSPQELGSLNAEDELNTDRRVMGEAQTFDANNESNRSELEEHTAPAPAATSYDRWLQAGVIAEIMDGLPLALDQAAAYIEETDCGLTGYVERYQKRRIALLSRRGGLRPDHPESIAATWSLSFEKIEQAHPAAAELLRLCAFLHPDAITEEMLREGGYELTPHLHLLATDPFELDAAIGTLTTFSLLRRDPDGRFLTLHRLVQTVLREQIDDEARRVWAERAVQCVERAFPTVSVTTWQCYQHYLPHALTCGDLIEQMHIEHPAALSLLAKIGSYLYERAQYGEAERLLTNTPTLKEATLATGTPACAERLDPPEKLSFSIKHSRTGERAR